MLCVFAIAALEMISTHTLLFNRQAGQDVPKDSEEMILSVQRQIEKKRNIATNGWNSIESNPQTSECIHVSGEEPGLNIPLWNENRPTLV
jgi:hypothetical protein